MSRFSTTRSHLELERVYYCYCYKYYYYSYYDYNNNKQQATTTTNNFLFGLTIAPVGFFHRHLVQDALAGTHTASLCSYGLVFLFSLFPFLSFLFLLSPFSFSTKFFTCPTHRPMPTYRMECYCAQSPRLSTLPGLPGWTGFPRFQRLGLRRDHIYYGYYQLKQGSCPLKFLSDSVPARRTRLVNGCQASLKSAFG